MEQGLSVRELRRTDCAAAADLHVRAFPAFFLSALGPRFLRAMYRGFASLPGAVGRVVVDGDGRVVAVVAGTVEPAGFFRALLRAEWWATITSAILVSLRRPSRAPRLLKAVVYRGGVPFDVDGALLSSICVDPAVGGRGIGRLGIAAWLEAARAQGARSAYLTTDAVDNDAVLGFYERTGWREVGRFTTREGRQMACLDIDLDEVAG